MIIMKFGGTSVADASAIARLVDVVRAALRCQPLVVVSALHRVTDFLLALEHLEPAAREQRLTDLLARHIEVARGLGLADVQQPLGEDIEQLRHLLTGDGGSVWTDAFRDRVVGYGELLSSDLVTAALISHGIAATRCDARDVIRTDARFGAATPNREAIATLAAQHLQPVLTAGGVPVTQGFIGRTGDGRETTLGRGGSDFTAALLGAALGAERVEIWTDVDGIMTADPRMVPGAHVLPQMRYDEAAELAAFGAKVLHPATQLPLAESGIPIVIRNTFAPGAAGTRVTSDSAVDGGGPITSIAFRPGTTILRVRAARMLGAFGFLRRIFEVFERHEMVVDVLASSEVSVSLTVDPGPRLAGVIEALQEVGEVTVQPECGIVAVVGHRLRETPGVAARVFGAIADVNVLMVSQGASASNLTFLVPERDGPGVVRALHDTFFPEVPCGS